MNRKAKIGRPKLPKGQAKGRIVPVRFTRDDLKAMAADARAKKQTISQWIRIVLQLETKQRYKEYLIELLTSNAKEGGYEASGWITRLDGAARPISVSAPGRHLTKEAAMEAGVAWCKEKIDLRPREPLEHD